MAAISDDINTSDSNKNENKSIELKITQDNKKQKRDTISESSKANNKLSE